MAKPRVHEVAEDLGIESKNSLTKLGEMGEYVRSASSTIRPPVVRRLKEMYKPSDKPAAAPAPAAATPTPASAPALRAGPEDTGAECRRNPRLRSPLAGSGGSGPSEIAPAPAPRPAPAASASAPGAPVAPAPRAPRPRPATPQQRPRRRARCPANPGAPGRATIHSPRPRAWVSSVVPAQKAVRARVRLVQVAPAATLVCLVPVVRLACLACRVPTRR